MQDWFAQGRWKRWTLLVALSYALALLATLPASVAAEWAGLGDDAKSWTGTVWHGASLQPGGHDLRWRAAPFRSLMRFGLAADARLTGPETDIAARAVLRPGLVQLHDAEGRTGWSLIRMFGLDTRTSCDLSLRVDLTYLALGETEADADGTFSSGGGDCTGPNAPGVIPPLTGVARADDSGAHLEIAARDRPGAALMSASFAPGGALRLAVTPEGAAALPALRGATSLEISP